MVGKISLPKYTKYLNEGEIFNGEDREFLMQQSINNIQTHK